MRRGALAPSGVGVVDGFGEPDMRDRQLVTSDSLRARRPSPSVQWYPDPPTCPRIEPCGLRSRPRSWTLTHHREARMGDTSQPVDNSVERLGETPRNVCTLPVENCGIRENHIG
ncbi:hypothetical protein GCM10010932_16940 [Agromyces flavus]|nr:hypothetical protein GCM10010932_16940 [Agromyces flavus]